MTEIQPLKAFATLDQSEVIMARGKWRQRIAALDLHRWITFYRTLRDRERGQYRPIYVQPVEALEALATALGQRLPSVPKPKVKK